MAVLKCKMCGGDLNFQEGATVVECEYCGTKQTVPTIDDEKKITLFARANRLRFACEFDKASGVYESIVADFPTEAEAYWGLVLCKYGIEYVDDPATGKKIPTCHRSSFDSVMEDDNFDQVMENADPIARAVYRDEAKQIEELRRGIIEVSNKEEPYDIFICYKETAENGERTIDSVIAQDVYNELTEKGYRVFFSRITLEDKLGQEYEPYIFAALNSAKIMLAFGTDYEYYNAVWVKNEWSRFLQLIAKGEKKTLIPCYKNIDAYDMPKEFARLQAQDMGKVGAMQDLLRGIEKLLPKIEDTQTAQAASGKETVIVQQPAQSATTDSLLKRAFMYLEDGDWKNAADYCNRVLDIDPENADAYVGLLMAELQVRKDEELARQKESFEQNKYFIKAVRFAGEERRKVLEEYSQAVAKYLAEQQDLLLKQTVMYLENCVWNKAADCCNRVLDISPENADAYVGLLMAELQVRTEEELAAQTRILGQNEHFLKAVHFAGEERRKVLEQYSMAVEKYLAEQQQLLDDKKRQMAEKRRNVTNAKIFASEDFLVAIKKCDGSKAATTYFIGNYPWKNTDIVALATALESRYISKWEWFTVPIGLKSDGTVVESFTDWKYSATNWSDIIAIAGGDEFIVGLKSDGTVVATGFGGGGRCNVSDWRNIIAIATGNYYTVGLKSDGTMVATGDNKHGKCNVSDWKDIVAIAVSNYHTVGLKSDGTAVATGEDYSGKCNVSDWRDIVAIAVSDYHTVGLKSDGTVVATGDNGNGQCNVSNWSNIIAIAAGKDQTVGLKSDGTILTTNQQHYIDLEQEERRQSNLCQHCGGEFKGLLIKKCSVCGKPKDY